MKDEVFEKVDHLKRAAIRAETLQFMMEKC